MKIIPFGLVTAIFLTAPSLSLAFDPSTVPHVSESARARIEEDFAKSTDRDHYYLAVSESGSWASRAWSKATEADLIRGVIQKCEHIAQAPCGLAVRAGESIEFRLYPTMLRYPREFDLALVPFISENGRNRIGQRYAQKSEHRALALTRNGGFGFATGGASDDEAAEAALADCHGERKRRCFLYSVDGRVVFSRSTDMYVRQTSKNW